MPLLLDSKQLIFYEIAMSIGNSLDLRKMLRESLSTYLRKLNCSAGGICMLRSDAQNNIVHEQVIATPRSFYSGKLYEAISANLPETPREIADSLPIHGQVDGSIYFHILGLPEFGHIILIKNDTDLDPYILKSLTPLNGKLARACLSCLHKTELERTNSRLKNLNEKLEQSNKELKDLTHIASHDLTEPLRKVSAFTKLLEKSLKDKLGDDDKENLDFIMEGAQHMRQMVKALRDYSMIISKCENMQDVDLNILVHNIIRASLNGEIEQTGAEISIAQPLHKVRCHPQQIQYVIESLLSNAIKYHKPGVRPQVKVSSRIWGEGFVRIEIQDNGIGIEPDEMKNLFVIFKRLYSHKGSKSVSIALAILKRIIEQNGGNIGANSAYGQGSTFWFTLPRADDDNPVSNL